MNTPQFEWSATKMDKEPMPVAPNFQPELAAEAIHFAATHDIREITLTGNTKVAILGNSLFPSLGDHYLARNGYDSQLTDENNAADRPCNLWHAADEDRDFGTHGAFGACSKEDSYYWRAAKVLLGLRARLGI